MDVATGAVVAAAEDNAVGAVAPPSSTKDKDAYLNVLVAFKGAYIGAFVDGVGKSAAASALLPPHCRRRAVRRRPTLHCHRCR